MRPELIRCLALAAALALALPARAQTIVVEVPNFQGGAFFGDAVATLDGKRFIVGASGINFGGFDDAGQAYLFSATGTHLATFNNPTPRTGAYLGVSVAGISSNRVIVGATDYFFEDFTVGEAYLYNTNGSLLKIFTNPNPQDFSYFGWALCAVGTDRVLIGSPGAEVSGVTSAGKAYLFSTNGGSPVRTFNNPAPFQNDNFGASLVALGPDRLVIGAYLKGANRTGAAYIFHTDGTLLTTLTNPQPANNSSFAHALATMGTDRLVVGAYSTARGGMNDVGEAYLFSTNGALLATLTNPVPAAGASFGGSVSVIDGDKILIGADGFTFTNQFTTNTSSGRAYLFSTNGTLLGTFNNPTNGNLGSFGWACAPVSSNYMAISANKYTVPSPSNSFVGRTYLVPLPPLPGSNVSLSLSANSTNGSLSWLAVDRRILQETTNLNTPVVWTDSALTVTTNGVTNSATVPTAGGPALRAFRLRLP
jgi:hypothetical protein